jgi:hypothetical protein
MVLCVWLEKYIPDVVSVPERKDPPLSIEPSYPSVDRLLSARGPPVGLCSGIDTTRGTRSKTPLPVIAGESSGRENTLMDECLCVEGFRWGSWRGFVELQSSVFEVEVPLADEWLYAGETCKEGVKGERSCESPIIKEEGSFGDGASNSASRDKADWS